MMEEKPLALLPVCGKTFVEHWLEQLAIMGAKEIRILAADRPEQIRAFVGDGARWGMRITVVPEMRELSVEQARTKYQIEADGEWLPRPSDIILAESLPGLEKFSPFASYAAWFQTLAAFLERRMFPNYIGLHEVQPNVWVGRRARIASTAIIQGPCWIGANAWIGEQARVGPGAVIEDGAFVDARAVVDSSVVAPDTYVGCGTELRKSFASGSTLINWTTNGVVVVPERFLLCHLDGPHAIRTLGTWMTRLAALVVLMLTLPFATSIALRSWLLGQSAFRLRKAVRPSSSTSATARAVLYYELLNTTRWWRRWPQLWNVLQGDFSWVGNRPLTAIQAGRLITDFERLWLAAPIGLVSLADREGCVDTFDEETRAHSSYYAVQANRRLKISIVRRALAAAVFAPPHAGRRDVFPVSLSESVIKQGQV
jgi:hypothetical protein